MARLNKSDAGVKFAKQTNIKSTAANTKSDSVPTLSIQTPNLFQFVVAARLIMQSDSCFA